MRISFGGMGVSRQMKQICSESSGSDLPPSSSCCTVSAPASVSEQEPSWEDCCWVCWVAGGDEVSDEGGGGLNNGDGSGSLCSSICMFAGISLELGRRG